jgi:hypothetical protein
MTNTTSNMNLPVDFEITCTVEWLGKYNEDGSNWYEERYGAIASVLGHQIAEVDSTYKTEAAAIQACKEEIRSN